MKINKEFMKELAAKYNESLRKDSEAWDKENDKVNEILSLIEKKIEDRYEIDSPIKIGGTSIVLKVIDKNLKIPSAIKCARPIEGKEIILTNILESEISRLRDSIHPNIISIFYFDSVKFQNQDWPFYVMEYIKDAVDAFEYLDIIKRDYKFLINLFKQCINGLVFLHSKETIHGDIKLENILVSPEGIAKISDLGSARLLTEKEGVQTRITFTRAFAHPELIKLVYDAYVSDPNRVSIEIPRYLLKKHFDLYSFGKNIFRIIKKYDIIETDLMPPYFRSYFGLMAARMLDGYNSEEECALNLPKNVFQEIRYSSAFEVLEDINKISGEYSLNNKIPELNCHFQRTIQISTPTSTPLTTRVSNIISSPFFRRLAGISQLGLIVQIYPTATHSRLEHVLGTYSNIARFCDALWNDQANPLFRQIMSEYDIHLILLAALFHDIGQYSLAHDLEESDSTLFSHKYIGDFILRDFTSEEAKNLRRIIKEDWGVESKEVADLLMTNPSDLNQPLKSRLLITLLDSPIDADKLDYLIRDSINVNVPYGNSIDIERLLRCLTIVFKQEATKTFITLGIHEKGKIPAEALAFTRYAMFGTVYWHHTSRSVKAMLHRAVWEMLPPDRRDKEYKNLKKDFINLVMGESLSPKEVQVQIGFLKEKQDLLQTTQLNYNDYTILNWIYNKTSESGKSLIRMVCERSLFKRLLVISQRKNPQLWDKMASLVKEYNWIIIKEFQKDLQNKFVDFLKELHDSEREITSVLSIEKTDEIVARNIIGEILFLVDIPKSRPGSLIELHFLPESRIYGNLSPNYEDTQIEDSIIWTELNNNFLKSVGKVRVLCHPDIAETCNAGLKRVNIESMVESSYRYVTQ